MKKIKFFLFLFILYLFIPNKVYADTWFDEGNYNPNWREKCSYNICKNFDERDLAGIVSSDLKSEEVPSISEIYFVKKDLDFTGHIWIETPGKLYGKILDVDTITMNYGGFIEKNFRISNSVKINYIYKVTDIPEGVSVDKTEGLRKGDKIRVKVTPKEGYTYELKYAYIDYNLKKINSNVGVTKVEEDTYEIVVSKYNVGFELKYIPSKYNVNFDLDEGVLIPRDDYINYHENKTINFRVSEYYTITSIVVDGEMVDFTDNSITLYGDKDYQVEVKTIKNKPDNIKRKGSFSVQLNINKMDPNNNFLHDCVFQLRDKNNYFQLKSVPYDDIYSISFYNNDSTGAKRVYNADSVTGDYYLLYQMLSSKYQKMIDSVKTAKDLDSLKNSKLFIHNDVSIIDFNNNIAERFSFYYPLILDEVKAPLGFKKEKRIVVVPFLVNFVFYLDKGSEKLDSNSPLVGVYLSFDNRDTTYVIDYDESLINDNFNDYILKKYENNINSDSKICSRGIKSRKYGAGIILDKDCEVTIIDQPGTPKLEIINTVNNKNNLTVTKNSKLEYKVTLNNIGTATSTENVIVTEIPKGIEYVVDSASDNGFYDAENNTITWNLDSIDEGGSHEFRFNGIVSDGAVANKNYIQNSYVSSKQLARVNSNETVVKLLTNPITFSSLILFMFTVLLVGVILVFGTQLIRDVK